MSSTPDSRVPYARWIKARPPIDTTLGRRVRVEEALRFPTIKEQRGYLDTHDTQQLSSPSVAAIGLSSLVPATLFPHTYPCLAFYPFFF